MNSQDLQTYSTNVHRGIAAAFIGEKLGAHAYTAIQAPHTITYPFRLSQPSAANINRAMKMNRAIEAHTGSSNIRITTENGLILVEAPSPDPVTIEGTTIMGEGLSVPVGMSSRRQIVGVDFESDSHLLIVGASNKGKTVCARNVVYQLLRQHSSDEIQVVVSCFKRKNWEAFKSFATVISDMEETIEMLKSARELMYLRAKTGVETPRYFIVLDDCLNLFALDGVNEIMSELLPLARGCGINFILIAQRLAGMDRKVTGNCTAKILFNVADTADSGIVGGRSDLGAETLGRYPGDCLLIANDSVQRVASALVQNDDVTSLAPSKEWFCTSVETALALEKTGFAPVGAKNYEGVLNSPETAFAGTPTEINFAPVQTTDLRVQTRLVGRPKTDADREFVREMYVSNSESMNATVRAVWGSKGSNYVRYVQECIGEMAEVEQEIEV